MYLNGFNDMFPYPSRQCPWFVITLRGMPRWQKRVAAMLLLFAMVDRKAVITASPKVDCKTLGHRVDHSNRRPGKFWANVRSRGERAAVHPVVNSSLSYSYWALVNSPNMMQP